MESFFELDRMQFEAIPLPVEPLHIKMGEWPLGVGLRFDWLPGLPARWGRISGLAAW